MQIIDYNKKFKESLPAKKERLVLHTCCAVCGAGVLERSFLVGGNKRKMSDYFEITLYFYNPNIDTLDEYNKRAAEVQKLVETISSKRPHLVVENYVFFKTDSSCQTCIKHRLQAAANFAAKSNIKNFCTTLSVSPHKDPKIINILGAQIAAASNLNFLQADFKKENGFLTANQISVKLNLYRQNYCGCKSL